MRTARLGIADRNCLLGWWPDHPQVWKFLRRRQARRPREVCFWAVLAHEEAEQIANSLENGEFSAALCLLEQGDAEVGCVFPAVEINSAV